MNEIEPITAHLASCQTCQLAVEEFDQASDELIEALRSGGDRDPFSHEEQCLNLVVSLESRRVTPPGAAPTQREDTASVPAEPIGPYRLVRRIGSGGMGVVYEAVHTHLEKTVAIKILTGDRLGDAHCRARFTREMKAAGQLDHPNIVVATDAGETEGGGYLVMEFISGCDVASLVKRVGPLPVHDACEITRQAALGLDHAHRRELVHRDIKPSNLMLTPAGQVKILDLGLARYLCAAGDERLTTAGVVMGTFDYMAPEQAEGAGAVDGRADIYSLGCTLYYLLTGRPPFGHLAGAGLLKKMRAHLEEPPPHLASVRPDAPPALAAVVERMLAKAPQDRFETAAEVADALAPFAEGADAAALLRAPDEAGESPRAAAGRNDAIRPLPTARRPRRLAGPVVVAAVALALLGAAPWLAPLVMRLTVGEGTLVVEVEGDDIEARIRDKQVLIHDRTKGRQYTLSLSAKASDQRLPPGRYRISVADDSGLRLNTDRFEIVRGEQSHVRVTLESDLPAPPTLATPDAAELARRPSPADALRRESIAPELLAAAGGGDPSQAPANLVAILGGGDRFQQQTPGKLAFSPDGQHLLNSVKVTSLQTDPQNRSPLSTIPATVWDVEMGKEAFQFEGKLLGFSRDGRLIGLTADSTLKDWTTADWTPAGLSARVDGDVRAISPDGKRLAGLGAASNGAAPPVKVWDAQTGAEVATFTGHTRHTNDFAFSPDGVRLATASWDKTARIWNIETGKQDLALKAHGHWVSSVAFSPDGGLIADGAYDGRVRIWDAQTGRLEWNRSHAWVVQCVAFSPDGKYLASGDWNKTIKLWQVDTGNLVRTIVERDRVVSLAFSPDGRCLASSTSNMNPKAPPRGQVRIWDVASGELVAPQGKSDRVAAIAVSPDGRTLAAAQDTAIVLWDLATAQRSATLTGHEAAVACLAFSPDGALLVSGAGDRTLRVWDAPAALRGEADCLKSIAAGHTAAITGVTFDPQGKTIASTSGVGSLDVGEAKLWDASAAKELHWFKGPLGPMTAPAFSPDGQLLAMAASDHSVLLWDAGEEQLLGKLEGHRAPAAAVAFRPDGRLMAVAAGSDIALWDPQTRRQLFMLEGHGGKITGLVFRADGRVLAAAGHDGQVRLWDLSHRPPKATDVKLLPSNGIAFTPEGRYLASAHANDTIYLLRLTPVP